MKKNSKNSQTPVDDAKASNDLRDLIRELSKQGTTYHEIVKDIDAEWGWNESALKQLVRRDTTLRRSSKTTALIKAIQRRYDRIAAHGYLSPELHKKLSTIEILRNLEANASENDVDKATFHIGRRFQHIRRTSTLFEYPTRAAFVRWDWQRRRLVSVLIDTRKGTNGHVFAMKISGRSSRRMVIGDVLSTAQNTYFSGLAYQVSKNMGQADFMEVDAFDLEKVREVTSPNEIGLECFTISNQYLSRTVAPVTFQGLDANGNPISGLGAFVKAPGFEKYGISEETFSTAECSIKNLSLTELMYEYAAITVGPTSSEQFTDETGVATLTKDVRNGWAYIKQSTEGSSVVHFPQAISSH